jgi:hypothetical protein
LSQRPPADWEAIGHADAGTALTSLGGRLFIATSAHRLWRRFPVEADVPWRHIGEANNVSALAGSYDTLFCITADNTLWWRVPVESNVVWTAIGTGPPGGTKALAATRGMLYVVDASGALHRAQASRRPPAWQPVPFFMNMDASVNAMSAWGDILFASTSSNRLLRSDRDWIDESSGWIDIHHCNSSIGLAVVDGTLFVATSDNRLWRLGLHALRQP